MQGRVAQLAIHREKSIVYGEFWLAFRINSFLDRWSILACLSTLELLALEYLGEVADTSVSLPHLLTELVFHLSDRCRRLCAVSHGCMLWVESAFYTVIRKLPGGNNRWQIVWTKFCILSAKRMLKSLELWEFANWSRGPALSYRCSLLDRVAIQLRRCGDGVWWVLSLCDHF